MTKFRVPATIVHLLGAPGTGKYTIAKEMVGDVTFAEVDIDQTPELAAVFGIRSVPSVVVMKDGQPVDGLVGLAPKSRYIDLIKKHLVEQPAG